MKTLDVSHWTNTDAVRGRHLSPAILLLVSVSSRGMLERHGFSVWSLEPSVLPPWHEGTQVTQERETDAGTHWCDVIHFKSPF